MARSSRRARLGVKPPPKPDIAFATVAVLLVAAGTVAASFGQQADDRPLDAGAFLLVVLASGALAWRRTAPVAALGVTVAAVAVYLLARYPAGPVEFCVVVALFEVARLREFRASLAACAVTVAVTMAATLPHALTDAQVPALLLAVLASWLIVPWSIGALIHVRTVAARRSRAELAARAALEERMRVGREVHDVAGHGFAAVAMQAGVALLVFDEQPEQARRSLQAIQSTSAGALAELRTMLEAFHRHGDEGQGLPEVAALVENVRAAGLPVRLDQDEGAVPEQIGRAAYRVVQEALTNVLRHAGPTSAEVRLRRDGGALVVEVLDRGVGGANPRPGLGLDGMRSRVAAVGGELATGERPGGGFRVRAQLPIEEPAR